MSTVPIIQKKIGCPYSRIVAVISITPAAGKTTKGNIAATAHGSGCVIHQAMAQAKVASVTCPAYGNAVCNGAIMTSAKAAGPDRSLSRYAAVNAVRVV